MEDLKGKEIFSLEDSPFDILLGKENIYFIVDSGFYSIIKLNVKNRQKEALTDMSGIVSFGDYLYDEKSRSHKERFFYKDWIYLRLMEGDCDPGMCMLNLKTGKVMYAPEYFIKGKVLYYGVAEENDYNSIKLYKSNLDFTNSKYIGKYEKDWSKGQLLGINKVDGGYVYYHTLKHEGMSSKEITVKFKIKK